MRPIEELIEALTIFSKYVGDNRPTHCGEHDIMLVNCDPEIVSEEDKACLDQLGFFPSTEYDNSFESFRFGSC